MSYWYQCKFDENTQVKFDLNPSPGSDDKRLEGIFVNNMCESWGNHKNWVMIIEI